MMPSMLLGAGPSTPDPGSPGIAPSLDFSLTENSQYLPVVM